MRKALIGLALTTAMVAAPAAARDGAWYAGVEGGIVFGADLDIDYDANADGTVQDVEQNLVRFHTDTGWEGALLVGYDLGMFRLEGEAAYKRIGISRVTSVPGFDLNPGTGTTDAAFDGNITSKSLMANALVDLGPDDGLQLYAGGGVGYAWVDVEGELTRAPGVFVDDSDNGFAWQLIAGVRAPVSRTVDLGLKYRFFNVENLNMASPGGDRIETDFKSHSVLASLIFNFGAAPPPPPPPPPAPPPPPPAPPAPPPPPEMRTCPDGSRVPVTQPCPVPPPPPVQPSGERG